MTLGGIDIADDRIAEFCRRWGIVELALFGSAARGALRPDSDIDLLASFHEESTRTLFDEARMELELEQMLGRPVDLISRSAVEATDNPIRRNEILSSAVTVYAQRT